MESFQSDFQHDGVGASSSLSMEARSILRSIQTESSKLEQANLLARSDLHYFRARFNYYRLSLLRLSPHERSVLEPILSHFMELIAAREAENQESLSPKLPSTPPFLESVAERQKKESVVFDEPVTAKPERLEEAKVACDILGNLQVIQMALQAPASASGNQIIAKQISHLIRELEQKS